jgi:GR25 family glycosyltransferase involved in LPS biosynthesis
MDGRSSRRRFTIIGISGNRARKDGSMSFAGFYINLDKATDRDAMMRRQLGVLSLAESYSRFPGIDGATHFDLTYRSAGQVGCFLSHYTLLRLNIGTSRHLHVLEDDANLSPRSHEIIERIVIPDGVLLEYDIIFTEADLGYDIDLLRYFRQIVADSFATNGLQVSGLQPHVLVLDISQQKFACTSSYLVNRHSIPKICGLLETELSGAVRQPIDLFLQFLANNGHLRIGVTMPFITTIPLYGSNPSAIEAQDTDCAGWVSTLIRRALYVDCDARAVLDETAPYLRPASMAAT